ncbi:hypothetical protein CBC_A1633 [Clostridium botulinum C str. Eklund]|nr:hypothetical protein CBC_A1633 [Clostridium botulinum C str. Eklund]
MKVNNNINVTRLITYYNTNCKHYWIKTRVGLLKNKNKIIKN